MKTRALMVVSCLVLALAGCSPGNFMRGALEGLAPEDDEALAMQCFADLRARDYDALNSRLDRLRFAGSTDPSMTGMADALDQGEPVAVELVGCHVVSSSGKRRSNLTYQFQFAEGWVLAAVTIDTEGQTKRVVGMQVNPIPKSLGELNAFTLSGKSVTHYVMLALSIAFPALTIVALISCVLTPGVKRKWFWIVFILFGIGSVGLNWTTGEILFNPLSISVHLFGASILRPGIYAPWFVTVSLPLGAIIFLLRRKKLAAAGPPPPTPPAASVPSAN